MKPFIPKDDQSLPDFYQVEIIFLSGRKDILEIASHHLGEKVFEVAGVDDIYRWYPVTSIEKISFDKSFSKIVEIKKRLSNKNKDM